MVSTSSEPRASDAATVGLAIVKGLARSGTLVVVAWVLLGHARSGPDSMRSTGLMVFAGLSVVLAAWGIHESTKEVRRLRGER